MALLFGALFISSFLTKLSDTAQVHPDSLFSQRNSRFATDFYRVASRNSPGNFVFSPFSLQLCGVLLYSGSAGRTAEELAQGLKLVKNNRSEVVRDFYIALKSHNDYEHLNIANKIYFANNIKVKEQFHRIATRGLSSEAEVTDFSKSAETAAKINKWVQDMTRNKIKNLFNSDDFDASVYMTLANTIYFKGEWTIPFDTTLRRDFWVAQDYTKEVDMMFQLDDYKMRIFPELDAKVIQLEYKNTDISMLIILPNQRNGIRDLEQQLSGVDLVDLQNRLELNYVQLGLPKFLLETSIDLRSAFSMMGMGSLFFEPDFSNMVDNKNVKVDKALHKAFISVTELGTEAGASTGFSMHFLTKPELFVADHPFIFTIVSKTAVLFLGRYMG